MIISGKYWSDRIDAAAEKHDVDELKWIHNTAADQCNIDVCDNTPENRAAWKVVRDYASEALAETEAEREFAAQFAGEGCAK